MHCSSIKFTENPYLVTGKIHWVILHLDDQNLGIWDLMATKSPDTGTRDMGIRVSDTDTVTLEIKTHRTRYIYIYIYIKNYIY